MATYKGIQGYSVQNLSSDPTASKVEGQLWYNNSTGKFKIAVAGAGVWAATNAINTGRAYGVGTGTNTAALFASGNPGTTTSVESFDGTSWTEMSANLNTGRSNAIGEGTSTASMFAGGYISAPSVLTETWNGTSWTEVNIMNTGRYGSSSAGTSTAALAIAGNSYPGAIVNQVESWDGTSWTETSTDINTARYYLVGFGTTTAAIAATGNVPGSPYSAICESFNGTSWAEVADVNTTRQNAGSSGIQTAGVLFGGETATPSYAIVGTTNTWDGTSWTAAPGALATARYGVQEGAIGTASATLAVGGQPAMTNSEEWTNPVYSAKTVTVS